MSLRPIHDVILAMFNDLGMLGKIKQHTTIAQWESVAGERIAKVTYVESLEDGRMFVRVLQSTWRNELIFLKKDLVSRINAKMQENIVKDIIFR